MKAFRHSPVDELGVLVDGASYYRQLYRALLKAQRSIVMSGWQFDSGVALLRGADAERAETPVTLLALLKHLTQTRPHLRVFILAWDFHPILVMEREWMQKLVFDWTIKDRLAFVYDSNHAPRGCHHQKFVTIDGELSFLGGLDVAEHRWDERSHEQHNPLRLGRGERYKPFHDVHTFARGLQVSADINELFRARWERAGGAPFDPALLAPTGALLSHRVDEALPLPAKEVAICRTDPIGVPKGEKPCMEILDSHLEAIAQAQALIYAETQYFSSRAIAEALEARMRNPNLPTLDLVMVLNPEGETLKETIAMGLSQAAILTRLREVGRELGHRVGFYVTVPHCEADERPERTTYIHSKVMIIDDRWASIGSANLNNRSMGVDTELNFVVQTDEQCSDVGTALAELRVSLLAEHVGGERVLARSGLVTELEALISSGGTCRLRRHPSPTDAETAALALVDPQSLPFDPERVEPHEPDFFDEFAKTLKGLFEPRTEKG